MCHGQIVNTRVLTARISTGKPCAICDRAIEPGDEYVAHAVHGEDDGLMSTWKLCARCGKRWEALQSAGMDYCPTDPEGYMRETIRGNWQGWRLRLREAWDRLKRAQELKRARRAELAERIREIRERGRVAQEQETEA